jgi:hypothetical protein
MPGRQQNVSERHLTDITTQRVQRSASQNEMAVYRTSTPAPAPHAAFSFRVLAFHQRATFEAYTLPGFKPSDDPIAGQRSTCERLGARRCVRYASKSLRKKRLSSPADDPAELSQCPLCCRPSVPLFSSSAHSCPEAQIQTRPSLMDGQRSRHTRIIFHYNLPRTSPPAKCT